MGSVDRQQEFVLRTLEERQIRFVRLWFTDVLGYLKSVAIAPAELDGALEEGIGFDGSAIEGFARASESDMLARPDPATFQILPEPAGRPADSARMFCDITMPDGSPSWADPRYVLRRALSRAAERGFTFYTHPEIEFFLLKDRPSDGSARVPFHDPGAPLNLSKTARAFIAGLLQHAREITAVTNQWVNSYKRLFGYAAPGELVEAPTFVCWGHANRSALVRVPMYKPGKANSTRVEMRSLDSACNPYLAFALLIAAGMKGVEEGYELPPGAEDDVWSLSDTERRALGYDELPHNLADALRAMEDSELVAETLGEHVFDFFLRNKRAEWVDYRAEVTPFELRRYLPAL